MKSVLNYLSGWGQKKNEIEIQLDREVWRAKEDKAKFYAIMYGRVLFESKKIDKEFSLTNYPEDICIETLKGILEGGPRQVLSPVRAYNRLLALSIFYESILFDLPSISINAVFKLDHALCQCVDFVATSTAFKEGATARQQARLKNQSVGMTSKSERRRKDVLEVLEQGVHGKTLNQKADSVDSILQKKFECGAIVEKPYRKTKIREMVEKFEGSKFSKLKF